MTDLINSNALLLKKSFVFRVFLTVKYFDNTKDITGNYFPWGIFEKLQRLARDILRRLR